MAGCRQDQDTCRKCYEPGRAANLGCFYGQSAALVRPAVGTGGCDRGCRPLNRNMICSCLALFACACGAVARPPTASPQSNPVVSPSPAPMPTAQPATAA